MHDPEPTADSGFPAAQRSLRSCEHDQSESQAFRVSAARHEELDDRSLQPDGTAIRLAHEDSS